MSTQIDDNIDALKIIETYLTNRQKGKLQIVLVGDSGVGKSCLVRSFRQKDKLTMDPAPQSSIGNSFEFGNVQLQGKDIPFMILDTAGQERYAAITKSHYRGAEAVLIVFDMKKSQSFDNVPVWIEDTKNFAPENALIVLIGAKSDDLNNEKCQVSPEKACEFAMGLGLPFVETSAAEFKNVDLAFETAVRAIVLQKKAELDGADKKNNIGNGMVELKASETPNQQTCCFFG
jgi:Ras-related protein Rab-1A